MRCPVRLLAWVALIAIVWPSLGPAPWLVRQALAHDHVHAHGHAHEHAHAGDVPGSPTHALDHECFGCQVLKHLAHSPPSVAFVPRFLPPPQSGPAIRTASVRHDARPCTVVPPARAPPASITSLT